MTFDPTHLILDGVADPLSTRETLAAEYALGLRHMESVDWPRVNAAIIERWSESALEYVKRKAWKHSAAMRR